MGTEDQAVIDSLRQCGRSLGYVFQVRDDVLGIWSEGQTTGNPVGGDIEELSTFLLIRQH